MNLYYIENSFKQVKILKSFIRSNVNIIGIKSIEELKNEDLLIISNECVNCEKLINRVSNIIIWEDIFKKFYDYSFNMYILNYDFYYLKYSLKKALELETESIIVGSSYARFGIDEKIINDRCVNLALASQDIYYSCLIGQYVINRNSSIKKVFIGTGYYSFYHDLSRNKGTELTRVSNVYYPLFKDMHNCKELPQGMDNILDNDELFDVKNIVDMFCNYLFNQFKNNYFIDIRNRFNLRIYLKGSENYKWFEIDDDLKKAYSYERAQLHNKAIEYLDSYEENKNILNSFVRFCNEKNVKVCVISFPSTSFYKEYLLKEYKESYMKALNSIDGVVHFIDFNEFDIFTDEDFVDMDHLDKSGAIKISEIINKLNL